MNEIEGDWRPKQEILPNYVIKIFILEFFKGLKVKI
jgi:hypothetical protein